VAPFPGSLAPLRPERPPPKEPAGFSYGTPPEYSPLERPIVTDCEERLLIPTALALAFLGGLVLPNRVPWVVAAVTVAWIVLLLVDGTREISHLIGGAALGALNASVGAAIAWAIRRPRTE
jgi:hypothetical protein